MKKENIKYIGLLWYPNMSIISYLSICVLLDY